MSAAANDPGAASRALLAVAVVCGTLAPGPAAAGCILGSEASQLEKSVRLAARCNDRILRSGPGTICKQSPPPACAGTLVTDAVALGYGSNDPPSAAVDHRLLKAQLNCQKRIGRAMASYVGRKLRDRVNGIPEAKADVRARRQLDKLRNKCLVIVAQDASGVVVPAVGPQCAAALPPPGSGVDSAALRGCLHTLLGVGRALGSEPAAAPPEHRLRPDRRPALGHDRRDPLAFGGGHHAAHAGRAGGPWRRVPPGFMTTPLCCPSRSSILSGQYSHRTGVYKNGGNNGGADDFDDTSSVGTWLQAAGYRTSLIGKWHGMKNVGYFNYRIVEPDGMGGYVENFHGRAETDYSTVLREKAKTFITDSVAAGEPFLLYLAVKAPHGPFIAAPRHDGLFQTIAPWRPPSYNEADVSGKPTWVQNTPLLDAQGMADMDQLRIDQLEMLQAVDEAIGGSTTYGITGIMEHLRNLGIADDTMVVFFSDNGFLWGEHRMQAKNKPFEEAIRSPMLVYYPKLAPLPRTETRFALNIDLASTFAELAGASVPITQDGRSLVRVIDGTQPTWRTDFLTEGWPGSHPWATVHEAQWKYTETAVTPGDPNTVFELELYDLVNDPYELTNVASDPQYAARITAMAARLRQLRPNWPIDSDPNGPDPPEADE